MKINDFPYKSLKGKRLKNIKQQLGIYRYGNKIFIYIVQNEVLKEFNHISRNIFPSFLNGKYKLRHFLFMSLKNKNKTKN